MTSRCRFCCVWTVISLSVALICVAPSYGQDIYTYASTTSNPTSAGTPCVHGGTGVKLATCSETAKVVENGASGAATGSARASYGFVGIAGNATVSGAGLGIAALANGHFDDFVNFPDLTGPAYFSVSAEAVVPSASASVTETVSISAADNCGTARNQCVINTTSSGYCTTTVPICPGGGGGLTISLSGGADAECWYPCTAASASFSAGYKSPGGAKVLAIRVVDANGNPVSGATITARSGHNYPTHFASTTTLTSGANPSTLGQPVVLTATIASFGRSGTPTGRVTFKDSTTGTTLGHSSLTGGVATFMTSTLTSGTHTITATYGGDVWSTASHAVVSQVVN